jgi:NADPH2:quinone reductase
VRALQIQRFGEPADALRVVELAPHALREGEVRVRVTAAGINPSDVANAKGAFPSTTLPRTIGRDYAGEIVEGPPDLIGLKVWGSGGDLGFTRDGTHAEFVDIPVGAVSEQPKNLSAEEAASAGVPFITACQALESARFQAGEWVIVTGAAGAVGSAAVELVHARGGLVIGLVKDASQAARLNKEKVQAAATSAADDLAEVVREATGGKGAGVALNGIGASVGGAIVASLAAGGRMAVYGAALGGREIQLDLFSLYRKRLEIVGVNTSYVDAIQGAAILNSLRQSFENGTLEPPRIAERYNLDEFAVAYDRVRTAAGKVVFDRINPASGV